jgi:hypothetical protein
MRKWKNEKDKKIKKEKEKKKRVKKMKYLEDDIYVYATVYVNIAYTC